MREVVFQLLYGHDWPVTQDSSLHRLISKELRVSAKVTQEAQLRVKDIRNHVEELDQMIASSSKSYELDRIPKAERNILRLGVFEVLYDEAIPPKVAIAEAIRLGRKFSTPESAAFINAILDEIYRKHARSQNDSNSANNDSK